MFEIIVSYGVGVEIGLGEFLTVGGFLWWQLRTSEIRAHWRGKAVHALRTARRLAAKVFLPDPETWRKASGLGKAIFGCFVALVVVTVGVGLWGEAANPPNGEVQGYGLASGALGVGWFVLALALVCSVGGRWVRRKFAGAH